MIRIPRSGEEVLGVILAVMSLLIAALHAAGLLETAWARETVPIFTLVIVGLVAGYLGFGTTRKLDGLTGKLDGVAKQILSTLGGAVEQFEDISKVTAHIRDRIRGALEVDDLTWGPAIQRPSPAQKTAYAKYRLDITDLSSKKNVRYREVMTFPDTERMDLAQDMLRSNLPSYQLRYYDTPARGAPPLVRFIIIDDEVIFVQHRQPALPAEGVVWVSVTHPKLVELAKVYFAEVWEDALPADLAALERIRTKLAAPERGA